MGNVIAAIDGFTARYRKTIVAVIAPVVVVVDTVITGGAVNWPVAIASVLVALGVYVVPNAPAPPAATPKV